MKKKKQARLLKDIEDVASGNANFSPFSFQCSPRKANPFADQYFKFNLKSPGSKLTFRRTKLIEFWFLGAESYTMICFALCQKSWRIPICHVEGKKMCLLCNGQFHSFLFFWKSELHSSIIFPAAWVLWSRLHHPWWKRCLRNTRAALKQVRIRNSGHILARRAAAGLKASRCALYPLLALHSFTSDHNARGFCECIIVGHCTHNWTRLPV